MSIVSNQSLNQYRFKNTKPIDIGSGQTRRVRMTPNLWEDLHFLQVVEGRTTAELATFAFEEMQLAPGESFDRCFRGIVAFLANRWT